MINNLDERQIVNIWQHLLHRTELVTEDGEPIKIIYPGRMNDDRGADFRDAVIATRRGLVKGDIEVHVKSSDWRVHQHHRDPAYNRVVLHIVMRNDAESATNRHNGTGIPTLALDKFTKSPVSQWLDLPPALNTPCLKATDGLTIDIITEFLDTAGKERFLTKAAEFQADLAQMEASQALYLGIMGALGYSKNKLPFLELARRLPLRILESQNKMPAEECLARQQALLLGSAGLLPSQRRNGHQETRPDDKWIDRLEKLWTSSRQTKTMSPDAWHLFKVRPSNFPVRRIVAMTYLILRYRERGILEGVINIVKGAPVNKGHRHLENGLLVTTNGYWASHFDFGWGSRIKNPTLLGITRAADIVVNVILPFTFAWSQLASPPELENKALDLYYSYPRLAVNAVERHMSHQLEINRRLVNSARRQQGLIHIYNTLCTQGRCDCCHLSQLEAGRHIQI